MEQKKVVKGEPESKEEKVVSSEEPDKTWERQRIISWLISKGYPVPVFAQDSFTVEQLLDLVEDYSKIDPGDPEKLPQLKTGQSESEVTYTKDSTPSKETKGR